MCTGQTPGSCDPRFSLVLISIFLLVSCGGTRSSDGPTEDDSAGLPGGECWLVSIGGQLNDIAETVIQTADGGLLLAGGTHSKGAGGEDIWLIKTDASGSVEWDAVFGGAEYDNAKDVIQTSFGDYLVAGKSVPIGGEWYDYHVLLVSAQGALLWEKAFGGEFDDRTSAVRQTPDGGFVVCGHSSSYEFGVHTWVLKLDMSGDVEWERRHKFEDAVKAYSMDTTTDGGLVFTGEVDPLDSVRTDLWLMKSNANGEPIWERRVGGDYTDKGYQVRSLSDGGFAVAGQIQSLEHGSDFVVIRFDTEGNELWRYQKDKGMSDYAISVVEAPALGVVAAGQLREDDNPEEGYVVKLDADGALLWEVSLIATEHIQLREVTRLEGGGYVAAGVSGSPGSVSGNDVYLARLTEDGDACE